MRRSRSVPLLVRAALAALLALALVAAPLTLHTADAQSSDAQAQASTPAAATAPGEAEAAPVAGAANAEPAAAAAEAEPQLYDEPAEAPQQEAASAPDAQAAADPAAVIADLHRRLSAAQSQLAASQSQVADLRAQVAATPSGPPADWQATVATLQSQLDEARGKIVEQQTQVATLQEQVRQSEASEEWQVKVTLLLQQLDQAHLEIKDLHQQLTQTTEPTTGVEVQPGGPLGTVSMEVRWANDAHPYLGLHFYLEVTADPLPASELIVRVTCLQTGGNPSAPMNAFYGDKSHDYVFHPAPLVTWDGQPQDPDTVSHTETWQVSTSGSDPINYRETGSMDCTAVLTGTDAARYTNAEPLHLELASILSTNFGEHAPTAGVTQGVVELSMHNQYPVEQPVPCMGSLLVVELRAVPAPTEDLAVQLQCTQTGGTVEWSGLQRDYWVDNGRKTYTLNYKKDSTFAIDAGSSTPRGPQIRWMAMSIHTAQVDSSNAVGAITCDITLSGPGAALYATPQPFHLDLPSMHATDHGKHEPYTGELYLDFEPTDTERLMMDHPMLVTVRAEPAPQDLTVTLTCTLENGGDVERSGFTQDTYGNALPDPHTCPFHFQDGHTRAALTQWTSYSSTGSQDAGQVVWYCDVKLTGAQASKYRMPPWTSAWLMPQWSPRASVSVAFEPARAHMGDPVQVLVSLSHPPFSDLRVQLTCSAPGAAEGSGFTSNGGQNSTVLEIWSNYQPSAPTWWAQPSDVASTLECTIELMGGDATNFELPIDPSTGEEQTTISMPLRATGDDSDLPAVTEGTGPAPTGLLRLSFEQHRGRTDHAAPTLRYTAEVVAIPAPADLTVTLTCVQSGGLLNESGFSYRDASEDGFQNPFVFKSDSEAVNANASQATQYTQYSMRGIPNEGATIDCTAALSGADAVNYVVPQPLHVTVSAIWNPVAEVSLTTSPAAPRMGDRIDVQLNIQRLPEQMVQMQVECTQSGDGHGQWATPNSAFVFTPTDDGPMQSHAWSTVATSDFDTATLVCTIQDIEMADAANYDYAAVDENGDRTSKYTFRIAALSAAAEPVLETGTGAEASSEQLREQLAASQQQIVVLQQKLSDALVRIDDLEGQLQAQQELQAEQAHAAALQQQLQAQQGGGVAASIARASMLMDVRALAHAKPQVATAVEAVVLPAASSWIRSCVSLAAVMLLAAVAAALYFRSARTKMQAEYVEIGTVEAI